MLTLVVVPVVYLLADRFTHSRGLSWLAQKIFGAKPESSAG
jgi:hypothetical protein